MYYCFAAKGCLMIVSWMEYLSGLIFLEREQQTGPLYTPCSLIVNRAAAFDSSSSSSMMLHSEYYTQ